MIFQFRDNEKVLQTPSMINKNKSTLRYLKIKPVKIKDKKEILKVGRKDYLQLSSVTQSCPTLWEPMDCSTPGLPDHHQLTKFTQTHVHLLKLIHPLRWMMLSNHLIPFSSHLQSFPASESLQMTQFFTSSGQSIGVSASVLPMNTQD